MNSNRIPENIQGAISGFLVLLLKGLIDDPRWDWDIDLITKEQWRDYQKAFLDPTHFRTTLAVYSNNLRFDADGAVKNFDDAKFRGFQYFRAFLGWEDFTWNDVDPDFLPWELEEPDWEIWEA